MSNPMSPAELIETYQRGLWRYLRFLGCSAGEADDLVQETFLSALTHPFEQRSAAENGAYLRRVARNNYLMSLRRLRKESLAEQFDVADAVWDDLVGDSWGEDYLAALDECLQSLTDRAREAIDLRYREGVSRHDMAKKLDMADDGIKTLLRRTRDTLRQCIQRRIKS